MTQDSEATVVDANQAIAIGIRRHQAGLLNEAEEVYRAVLKVEPDHPDALHWLGVLLFQQKRADEGLPLIERSIAAVPDHPDYLNNYGNALQAARAYTQAERAYRRCLELRPDQPDVLCNLALCLRRSGRPEDAVATYEYALGLDFGAGDNYAFISNMLQRQGKFSEAVQAYEETLANSPHIEQAFAQLARLFYSCGRVDDAAKVYRRWLEVAPDHPLPKHKLAACTGEQVPEKASAEMVRMTFDGFADSFDKVLARLGYQTPEGIRDQATRALGEEPGSLDVLDVGCGTGLCGPLLRARARTLIGVDLSPGMLNKARERGVYDDLEEAELVAYLRRQSRAFDLIVCADTLCYFGTLDEVLDAAASALRYEGRFIFSVERDDNDTREPGYRIQPHGRYAHASWYVERAVADCGLDLIEVVDMPLRRELGEPVAGRIYTAGPRAHAG